MSKLFLLILAAFVLYLLIKGFGRKSSASAKKQEERESSAGERMVACAHCGVNLPQSEAVGDGERFFCGEPHRALGSR